MLLIFFLVTTSMNSYKGLGRQLPPMDDKEKTELRDVDKDRVMTLHLMADGRLNVDEQPAEIGDGLRKDLRHFIIEKGREHILEILVDRDADYDSYFRLQNQIIRAYKEIQNAAAQKKYGVGLAQCSEEQRETITKMYPQRIAERQ